MVDPLRKERNTAGKGECSTARCQEGRFTKPWRSGVRKAIEPVSPPWKRNNSLAQRNFAAWIALYRTSRTHKNLLMDA